MERWTFSVRSLVLLGIFQSRYDREPSERHSIYYFENKTPYITTAITEISADVALSRGIEIYLC